MTTYNRVYDVGDVYDSTVEFETFEGTDADPAEVSLTWITPAGVATTWVNGPDPQIVRDSAGNYHAGVPLDDESGQWRFEWIGSGGDPETSIRGVANAIITVRPSIASVYMPVTVDELETFMQRRLDPDTARETILDIAGEAEGILHRGIGSAIRTEQHAVKIGTAYVLVDGGPIESVASVVVDSVTYVAGTDYSYDRNGVWIRPSLTLNSGITTIPLPQTVSVTYTGGISKATRVRALQSIIKARCARRFMMNKGHVNGLTSEGMEGYSIAIMPDEFTDKELATLNANALPAAAASGGRFGFDGQYAQEPFWFNDIPRGGDYYGTIWG